MADRDPSEGISPLQGREDVNVLLLLVMAVVLTPLVASGLIKRTRRVR